MAFPGESRLFSLVKIDRCLDKVRDLLSRGEDPNSRSEFGQTPLIEAVKSCWETDCIVRELINAGADVNMCTNKGLTALHFAVLQRKRRAFEVLVKSGASINAKDHLGRTILHFAVTRFRCAIGPGFVQFDPWFVDELLKHEDLDINAVDSDGNTPLMVAIMCGRTHEGLKLLRNKANPNISNNLSQTPLHKAFAIPAHSFTSSLFHYGADIYSEDKNGQTPIDVFIQTSAFSRFCPSTTLKRIIFKYNITDELKLKFKIFTSLSEFINKCYEEVDQMKKDFISDGNTLYDFLRDRLNESEFENALLQIHIPVMEKLLNFDYTEYLCDILGRIPESNMHTILEMMASERKNVKGKEGKDLADLLSMTDINRLICGYLFYLDTFCLIAAFSKERTVNYQHDIRLRYPIFIDDT